jgi:hypothetical protein
VDRSISLAEIIDILEEAQGDVPKKNGPIGIILQLPVNACEDTDEDSGNEDNLNTNILPGSQLQSQAELCRHCSSDVNSGPLKKTKHHSWFKSVRPQSDCLWNVTIKQNPSPAEYIFSLFNESTCELTVMMATHHTANSRPNWNIQDSHSQQTKKL